MLRTAGAYLPRFRAEIDTLSELVGLRVIVGENDSRDDTKDQLAAWKREADYDVTVLDCGDGSQHFASVDDPERWRSIAGVMNRVLDEVTPDDDEVIYVDADLWWDATMAVRLLMKREMFSLDVLCPFATYQGRAFDLWGTRKGGVRITRRDPYWPDVAAVGRVEVDSAACFNVMDAHWARVARFGETDANVGWHDQIRAKGGRIWLDFDERVVHP
jgi:hypothetical protein